MLKLTLISMGKLVLGPPLYGLSGQTHLTYTYPTGKVSDPVEDPPYLRAIETKLTQKEKSLWAVNREHVLALAIQQIMECGLDMSRIETLVDHWIRLTPEELIKKLKAFPPPAAACMFQTLIERLAQDVFKQFDSEKVKDFLVTFQGSKDPAIVAALAYVLCFQPTATNAADTLAHFSCASTIPLVEKAITDINPEVGKLIHRLVCQEIFPLLSWDTYCNWGNSYFDEGNYREAIKCFSEAINKYDDTKKASLYWLYVLRGRCRLLLEEAEEQRAGQTDVKKAMELGMPPAKAYLCVGTGFLLHGISCNDAQALRTAICWFNKAQRRGERSVELFQNRFHALVRLGRYVEGDEDLIRAERIRRARRPEKRHWGELEVL
jgi:tetratricopeptide (TPR) repeat protein